MAGVSVSDTDRLNGSPKKGDMIAIRARTGEYPVLAQVDLTTLDRWLVEEKVFEATYMQAIVVLASHVCRP
jgi:hypothetical protein